MSIFNKKIYYWLMVFFGLILIINFSKDTIRLFKRTDRIEEAEKQLEEVEKKKRRLKKQKDMLKKEEFFESEARNKLFMAKEGEYLVILPEELKNLKEEVIPPSSKIENSPNWRQWFELFVGTSP